MSDLRELSVSEMNKLRAQLGLAPLIVDEKPKEKPNQDEEDSSHKVQEKLRQAKEKLMERKRSRTIKKRLPTLGDEDENDSSLDVKSWVERSRKLAEEEKKLEKERKEREKREREIEKEKEKERIKATGLKVQHNIEDVIGKEMIFTLKDEPILIGNDKINDSEDVLENVNLVEIEKIRRNQEMLKPKSIYDFDEEEKSILSKYDEVDTTPEGFVIGEDELRPAKKNFKRKSNKLSEENFVIEDESFIVGSNIKKDVINNKSEDDGGILEMKHTIKKKIRKTKEEEILKRIEENKRKKEMEEKEKEKDSVLFTTVDEFLSSIPLPDEVDEEDIKVSKNNKKKEKIEEMDIEIRPEDKEIIPSLIETEISSGKGIGATLSLLKKNPILDSEDEILAGRLHDQKEIVMGNASSYEEVAKLYPKEIKIESYDEYGRKMTPKERYREFSQKFHGTKSGINKKEKRMKKMLEEQERIKRQSTESTIAKLEAIKKAQKEQNKPFIIFKGPNQNNY